jgi:hypothetical protein
MVVTLRFPAVAHAACRHQLAGRALLAVLMCLGILQPISAQMPNVHYRHRGDMPPGAIGRSQLLRGGPLPGYFQPVEITAPQGAMISLAMGGHFTPPEPAPVRAGFLIGQVYRFKVTRIPLQPGREVFPSVEVIDRLYPPPGKEHQFPIPVQMTQQDLVLALQGKMVTRVIFVEDPKRALPVQEAGGMQNWFEARNGEDPLQVADLLGRPVAILRLGARVPDNQTGPDDDFLYGCPPWQHCPEVEVVETPAAEPKDAVPIPTPVEPKDNTTFLQPAMPLIVEQSILPASSDEHADYFREDYP